jgi:hypothetical protein
MPDPVRPVAPREDVIKSAEALILGLSFAAERGQSRPLTVQECEEILQALSLAVSPVPWAGSGSGEEDQDLTRGQTTGDPQSSRTASKGKGL